MKLVSWNVNGLRAVLGKDFLDSFKSFAADIVCLQETKMQEGQAEVDTPGYYQYFNSAEKKGYSGVAVFTKKEPISVVKGIGKEDHDKEGRVLTLEFDEFYLVNCYTPNAQDKLKRIEYRMDWEEAFRSYLKNLDEKKPVILCGDLNVAHREIDLKNPKTNRNNAGFSDQEREQFGNLLEAGFVDSFRYFNPDLEGAYSWWSYRFNARANNAGWRIDYFIVSKKIKDEMKSAEILNNIYGSDHCPVTLEIF